MKKLMILMFAMLGFFSLGFAQTNAPVEMADGLRTSGKIYVVVAVILLIVLGMLIYLFNLDRRIRKIENQ